MTKDSTPETTKLVETIKADRCQKRRKSASRDPVPEYETTSGFNKWVETWLEGTLGPLVAFSESYRHANWEYH